VCTRKPECAWAPDLDLVPNTAPSLPPPYTHSSHGECVLCDPMWVGTTPFFKGTGAPCGGQTQCESIVYLRHRDPAPYFAAATAAHPRRGLRCAAASVPVCHGVPVARRPGRRSVAARRRPGPAGARGVCRVFVFTKDTGSSPTSTCALSGANPGQPERAPRPNLPVIGQPGRGGRGLLVTRTHPSCVCVECLFSRTPSF